MPKAPAKKEKCVNHPDREAVFEGQCQECVEDFARDGDQEFIDYLESIKAMDEAAKEKKKKREKIEGIDTFELIADDVQSNIDLWFSGIDDFYFYDTKTGLWKNGADVAVKAFLTDFRRRKMKMDPDTFSKMKITTLFKETIAILKGRLAKTIQSLPTPDKRYIPLGNGIFDLETEELLPYSKEFFFTTKIPWNYNPDAKCKKFSSMMDDWYTSEKAITGWEIMALCLYRGYPIHKFFVLYSDGGQGKSTFLKILKTMLGQNNVCAIPITKLNEQFTTVGLHRKYANIADELPPDRFSNTEILKMATGESLIEAREIYKRPITFENYATMIFSLNPEDRFPESNDKTRGFYRRLSMIEFKGAKATKSPVIGIADRVTESKEEMEGILYKVIIALLAIKNCGWKLQMEDSAELTKQKHLAESNPLMGFISQYCEINDKCATPSLEFMQHLNKYMEALGKPNYKSKGMKDKMEEFGIAHSKERRGSDYNARAYWLGVRVDELRLHEFAKSAQKERTMETMNLEPVAEVQKLKAKIANLAKHIPGLTTEQAMGILDVKDADLVSELLEEVDHSAENASDSDESTPF